MRLVLLVLVAALAGLFVFHKHTKAAEESRLGAIASEIAGRPVSIHCQGAVGEALDVTTEAGSVDFDAGGVPADVARIKRKVCHRLEAFMEERKSPKYACLDTPFRCDASVVNAAIALDVLAHESWHLAGERNESATECYAQQTVGFVATKLGSDDVQARGLARLVHLVVYPRMPEEYRGGDCRDGGRLDLRPYSSAWPS
ncbi:MAG: hypothetical protein M3540_06590 [Actinomycetota bacterium]|nr:hypothetical protein [Actinomycetota bacterium]